MPNDLLVRPAASGRNGVLPRLGRRLFTTRWMGLGSERVFLVVFLMGITALCLAVVRWPVDVSISLLFPVVVISALLLSPRRLAYVYAVALVAVAMWMPRSGIATDRAVMLAVSMLLVMWMMVVSARARSLVGTRGFGGDRMFAELRDRIAMVGRLPVLPAGWQATSSTMSAHADRFSGDFVAAHLGPCGHRLEIVLVDVSGKGTRAGTRSLLLSGALGGLLGAVPAPDFLGAANDYLLRQGWEEGFATAVHLDVDLRTGEYSIGNAGHPAPALYVCGRARWTVLDGARGPLLGVVEGVGFPRQTGRLGRGDALLLYSDGVVEARGRDLVDGIDRMLGVASMSVLGQGDVARDVCESARSGEDDDRAAFSVRRL